MYFITERAFDRAFHFEADSGPKSLTPGLNKVRSWQRREKHSNMELKRWIYVFKLKLYRSPVNGWNCAGYRPKQWKASAGWCRPSWRRRWSTWRRRWSTWRRRTTRNERWLLASKGQTFCSSIIQCLVRCLEQLARAEKGDHSSSTVWWGKGFDPECLGGCVGVHSHQTLIQSQLMMTRPQIEGVSSQLDAREGSRRNLPHVWSTFTPKLKLIKVGPKTETRALPSLLLLLWKIWQGQNFDCNVHISTSARDPEIQLVLYFCNVSTHDICHSTGTIVHQSVSLIHNTQEGQRTWQH